MKKIWLDSYQHGVAHEIDVTTFASICDVFNRSVQRFHDRPAMACMGTTLSYGELGAHVEAFSRYLIHELGLQRGDRVAVMMPNVLQYPIAVFGILAAGLTVVNVNPLYTPRELEHQLKDSGARAIVILENFASVLEDVVARTAIRHTIVTSIGELLAFPRGAIVDFVIRRIKKIVPPWSLPGHTRFRPALAAGRRRAPIAVEVGRDDIAFLQYTGGTTGVSKGAMLLHSNIIANMLQAGEWLRPTVHEGSEVIVTALPLYHIFSLTANLMVFTELGALNILIPNPRDIGAFIKEMRRYPITAITGVNTLFNALLNHPDFATLDFSTWRLALGGGMAVQRAVAERWKTVTGTTLAEAYGLTETSPAACINPLNLPDYNGSIGLPIPSTDIQLRDSNGQEVADGESGELCIRGPQVMKGYWNRPDETARVIDSDGFLATGDMATMMPGGFVKLVDRKKDMILVSGFNVYPNEVEDIVASLPGVLEVACIGIADDKSGEAVKIFVVRKDPALSADDIIAHCRRNLTGYKVPKLVEFRDELPKTNVGKILRRALREPQSGHQPA